MRANFSSRLTLGTQVDVFSNQMTCKKTVSNGRTEEHGTAERRNENRRNEIFFSFFLTTLLIYCYELSRPNRRLVLRSH